MSEKQTYPEMPTVRIFEAAQSSAQESKARRKQNRNIGGFALKVAGVSAGAAIALVTAMDRNPQPLEPTKNGPNVTYIAEHGDTEWNIGVRAYPDLDPREAQEIVDKMNPNPDHLITPGQEFIFGADAEISDSKKDS